MNRRNKIYGIKEAYQKVITAADVSQVIYKFQSNTTFNPTEICTFFDN